MEERKQSDDHDSRLLRSTNTMRRCWSKRYTITVLCFFSLFLTEWMRVDFIAVVLHSAIGDREADSIYSRIAKWNYRELDAIEIAFSCGYAIGMIPGALLLMVFSAHKLMTIFMALSSLFHITLPYTLNHHYIAAAGLSVFHGFSQAILLPSYIKIFMQWTPTSEKTGLITLAFCGSYLAPLVNMPLSRFLIGNMRGENLFFITGILGLLWCLIWSSSAFERPSLDPDISEEELSFLERSLMLDAKVPVTLKTIPMKSIMTSLPAYAFCAAYIGYTVLYQMLAPGLYFAAFVNFFDTLEWIPHVILFPMLLGSGFLADAIINRKILSTTWTRKTFCTSAFVLCGMLLLVLLLSNNAILNMTLLHVGTGVIGFVIPGLYVNCLDIGGRYACVLIAIAGTFSSLTQMSFTRMVNPEHPDPNILLICSTVLVFISAMIFIGLGSGDIQAWALQENPSHPVYEGSNSQHGAQYYPNTDDEIHDVLVTDAV